MRDIVPVFCDKCALLALAQLDGAPLCADCLLSQVERLSSDAIERIGPLELEEASYSPLDDRGERQHHLATRFRGGQEGSKRATSFAQQR